MNKKIFAASSLFLAVMILIPAVAFAQTAKAGSVPASGTLANGDVTVSYSISGATLKKMEKVMEADGPSYVFEGTYTPGTQLSLSLSGDNKAVTSELFVGTSLTLFANCFDESGLTMNEFSQVVDERALTPAASASIAIQPPKSAREANLTGTFASETGSKAGVSSEVVILVVNLVSDSSLGGETGSTVNGEPDGEGDIPVLIDPGKDAPRDEPGDNEANGDEPDPWSHADPVATALISTIAALAAVLGGTAGGTAVGAAGGTVAAGFGESGSEPGSGEIVSQTEVDEKSGLDPAYERKNVPDYPSFVTGADGERISKMPNGNIEVSQPGGERIIHFPNGTVQVRNPDGSTWEEWPDGTVSTSDADGLVVKTPDGTLTHSKPNGEEMTYHPDGTSTETTQSGLKITRDESNQMTKFVTKRGKTAVRHPEDPDAFVMTSPHGGSLTYRSQQKIVHQRDENGKLEYHSVDVITIEGEIRTEDSTLTFKPDGTMEGRGDDGSTFSKDSKDNWKIRTAEGDTYEKSADGFERYQGTDGTVIQGDPNTGEFEARLPDGSYIKRNMHKGDIEARLSDGSYVKTDSHGNGSFVDTQTGLKGTVRSDGYKRLETEDATLTESADGTIDFQTKQGLKIMEKPDGTSTIQLPDGRSTRVTPDGAEMVRMPDNTVFKKSANGTTQIRRPDGQVQQVSGQDYQRELTRYNDWYNQHLEQWLKNQGQGGN